ncbi:MAG: hypothetical protein FNT29_09095 [Halothiobacillaceae bacterium]|nr:MAG: hypothetical protein FNT29_09095 [Halothiobacillaceae bacterium]
MAIEQVYKPYLGAGQVYARVEGASGPLAPIGNVSELKLAIDEESKEQTDYTHGGGGTYAEVKRVKGVTVSAALHDINKTNLARALYGDSAAVVGGTVTDEARTAYQGGLIRLSHPSPTGVVVTNDAGTTTYVAGVDYEVRPEGVYILGGAIANGAAIKIDYAYAGYDLVQALTKSGLVLEMAFGGVNEADSGKPVVVDLFRVSMGAAKEISLIGDDFASLQLEGKLLVDATKTGAGISRFLRVSMA